MNKILRYAATGATLSLLLFAGWGCSDDDNSGKTPHYKDPITITKAGKNFVSYHIEVAEDVTYRHLIVSQLALDNFTSGSKTEEEYKNAVRILMSLDAGFGTGPQDFTLRDLDKKPTTTSVFPYKVIAGLKYVALLCPADEQGNCIGDFQSAEFSTPAPDLLSQTVKVEIKDLRNDEIDLMMTPDPGIVNYFEYIFPKSLADEIAAGGKDKLKEQVITLGSRIDEFGELSEWAGLVAETDYIHFVLGIDKDGNHTKLIETPFKTDKTPATPTENIVFSHMLKALYYGQSEGDDGKDMYNFYILLSDKPMAEDEYGPYPTAFPCHAINCDFYTAAPAAGGLKIPEGTYTLNENYVAGACSSYDTWAAYFDEEENKTQIDFTSGTISVAWEGDGYRITIDLTKEDGGTYTGTFTGKIQFEDYSSYAPTAPGAPKKGFGATHTTLLPSRR